MVCPQNGTGVLKDFHPLDDGYHSLGADVAGEVFMLAVFAGTGGWTPNAPETRVYKLLVFPARAFTGFDTTRTRTYTLIVRAFVRVITRSLHVLG